MSNWVKVSSRLRSETLYSLVPAKYTFTPNREDVLESRFRLRYSSTCNSYYRDWADRVDPDSPWILPDWRKALMDWDSVHRIVDEETGKVYLDKYNTISPAKLKWSFDFGCCGLLVDQVTLRVVYEARDGGEFSVILTGDDGQKTARYLEAGDYVTFTELENSAKLDISIHFTGEAGQVTRLFPQTIMGSIDHPLDLQVTLKPPAEILGRPRVLVGVMYSTCQAVQVDGRHFKENSTSKSGRGFLHIHLARGRDLPVRENQTSCAKCCFLPDAKKLKCKTAAKKGSDPNWNEEFLVVGVTYHEVKRGALEVCVSGKNSNKLGGIRISVGYKNVIIAQTELLSRILERLTGSAIPAESSPKNESVSDDVETDSSQATSFEDVRSPSEGQKQQVTKMTRKIYRTTTRLSDLKVIVVEEEVEVDDLMDRFPEGDESFSTTSLDVLNIVRRKEGMATSSDSLAHQIQFDSDVAKEWANDLSCAASVVEDTEETRGSVQEDGISHDSNHEFSAASKDSSEDVTHADQLVNGETHTSETEMLTTVQMNGKECQKNGGEIITAAKRGDDRFSGQNDYKKSSSQSQVRRTGNNNGGPNCTAKRTNDAEDTNPSVLANGLMHQDSDKSENKSADKQNAKDFQKADSCLFQNSVKHPAEVKNTRKQRSVSLDLTPSARDSVTSGDELEETLQKNRLLRKALSDVGTRYQQESHSSSTEDDLSQSWKGRSNAAKPSARQQVFCVVRGFGRKLSLGKASTSSTSNKKGLAKYLEANVDRQMLDSEGLEMAQWLNVVNKPKQWHYCWHVLRSDMTYMS